jgi:hypothetical protein
MAKNEKKESASQPAEQSAEATPPAKSGRQRTLVMGGGLLACVAAGYVLALVAVPGGGAAHHEAHLAGPFVVDISPANGYQVNLAGQGGRHFLAMLLKAEVDAYEEAYATERAQTPLVQAKLTDAVLRVASLKTKASLDDAVGKEVFREELRLALDPVLFPIHVGDEHEPNAPDPASGLRPGTTLEQSTLRGLFHEHVLHVDAIEKTLQLDDGPKTHFQGTENDLQVEDAQGQTLYVDVSDLDHGFRGDVQVGVQGRIRSIYFASLLTQ